MSVNRGWLEPLIPWARRLLPTFGRDALSCAAIGCLLAFLATLIVGPESSTPIALAYLFGHCGMGAVIAWRIARPSWLEAELKSLKDLKTRHLISDAMYDRLVERTIEWYASRRFGSLPPPPPPSPSP